MVPENRQEHNKLQVEYFDKRADFFKQKIPEDIQERTAHIVEMAAVNRSSVVLDVGTGTGVLIGHLLAQGVRQTNIVGCDLSQRMLSIARGHYREVYFWHGDFMELSLSSRPRHLPEHVRQFDRIFFNACFANMLNPQAALQHGFELSARGGRVVVSHPAPEFVSWLHESVPQIVPHLLPTREAVAEWAHALGFTVEHFESTPRLYLAVLARSE